MSIFDELYGFQSGSSRLSNLAEWAKLPFQQGVTGTRQALGQTVEDVSGRLGIPFETHLSERITGGPNVLTGSPVGATGQAYAPTNQPQPNQPQPNQPQPQSTGGGTQTPTALTGGSGDQGQIIQQTGGGESDAERQAREAREALEASYGDYFRQLDEMLNQGLPAQRASQEELARLQYTGGVEALQPQLEQGRTLLARQRETTEANQARNLRDLAANIRNSMMAGNVFLGARGAGDSSAANQYSYALTKLGTRQRGDIMSQTADIMREIGDREVNLNNVYNAEVNRLANERDQKISSIASWFAEQQNALRQTRGEAAVNKSQNLLNEALRQLDFVQQEESNRRAALEQWALNNATNIQQVKANLQQISAFQPALPQAQPIVGQPITYGGGFNVPAYAPTGYGTKEEEEEKPLFPSIASYLPLGRMI